jgi:YD repeat-containing protein
VGSNVLASHVYSLDAQGRRAGLVESAGGVTKTWSYGYDGADRLVSANDGQASSFGYDVFGNRRTVVSPTGTLAYLYDAAHQLSTVRSGSDAGPVVGAAIHDVAGRMTRLCEGAGTTVGSGTCSGPAVLSMDHDCVTWLSFSSYVRFLYLLTLWSVTSPSARSD